MGHEKTRREFLAGASVSAIGLGVAMGQAAGTGSTPGAPPAFGTAPAVGPEVTAATFAESEKVVQAPLTVKDRAEVAGNWRQSMAAVYERRVGPRKLPIPDSIVPYSARTASWTGESGITSSSFRFSLKHPGPELPQTDAEIAFAPVSTLAQWLFDRKITSERLTSIYLERMKRYDGKLHCVITATPEIAMKQARAADAEIAAGRYKGPLHGDSVGRQGSAGYSWDSNDLWSRLL